MPDMRPEPAVTVVIPTRNRADRLVRAVDSVLAQTLPCEIIVLDDASADQTPAVIERYRGRVDYVRIDQPKGPLVLRNLGAKKSSGTFLATLDDDCELIAHNALEKSLRLFDHPRIAAVTLPFQEPAVKKPISIADGAVVQRQITCDFFGGMIVFRKASFLAAGGYHEPYFMHVEEGDLALRMLAAGWVIRLGKDVVLRHSPSPNRDTRRIDYLGGRNHLLFAWRNVPLPFLLAHFPSTLLLCAIHAARSGALARTLSGFVAAAKMILSGEIKRLPVPAKIYRLSRRLRRHGSLPLDRIEGALPSPRDGSVPAHLG